MIYKLEHLFNSALMFIFLVCTAGNYPAYQYGIFGAALAYYYLYLLLMNSTVLEPMQILIAKKYSGSYIGEIFLIVVKLSIVTWLVANLLAFIFLKFAMVSGGDYLLIFSILIAALFNAQIQIVRRVVLAQKYVRYLIGIAAWNFLSLILSLILMIYNEISILSVFLCWQILSGTVCFIWLLLQVNNRRRKKIIIEPIKGVFYRYALRNLPLTPFSWFFGNFPFIFGPSLFGAEALADYRKTINFTGPILQYFSITGIMFLSKSAKLNNVSLGFAYIFDSVRKRLLVISLFTIFMMIIWPYIASIESGLWRYLPSKENIPSLFFASIVFVYVESINYLVGSNYRANQLTFPLTIMSVAPCILLCLCVLINSPTSPAELVLNSAAISAFVLFFSIYYVRVKK